MIFNHYLIVAYKWVTRISLNSTDNSSLGILLHSKMFLEARSHDTFLRIRFLLVPKIRSCEHIENDLPTHGSVILKKRMEIEHALFSFDSLLGR